MTKQKPQTKVVRTVETKAPTKKISTSTNLNSGTSLFKPGGQLALDRINYIIMAAGFAVVLIGFALMMGGKTTDPNIFPADEIYSFRRITLAPIVVMIGFGIDIFAIFYRAPGNAEPVNAN